MASRASVSAFPSLDTQHLAADQIQGFSSIRPFDPNGRVFGFEGQVFRGIYPHRVAFVRRLFDQGVVESLVEKGLLVGTELTNIKLAGTGLVVRHEALDVETRPSEWSMATFLDAARQYVELMFELSRYRLTLVDGHASNVSLAPGGRTIWHDFGSIVELETNRLIAIQEFMCYFYFPLMLYKRTGSAALVRRLNMQCTGEEYGSLCRPILFRIADLLADHIVGRSTDRRIRKLVTWWTAGPRGPLNAVRAVCRYFSAKAKGQPIRLSVAQRLSLADRLRADLERVRIRYPRTIWSGYHDAQMLTPADRPRSLRYQTIDRLLEKLRPDRVLDVGANQGVFSHMAYRYGRSVISSDSDEAALNKHVEILRERYHDARIYPVLCNVMQINEHAVERFRSHTVLALALTHHLRLGQGYPFGFIVRQLAGLTGQCLVTEFMRNGLGGARGPHPDPLPDDYRLDNFLVELRKRFREVRIIDYEAEIGCSPRTLICCLYPAPG